MRPILVDHAIVSRMSWCRRCFAWRSSCVMFVTGQTKRRSHPSHCVPALIFDDVISCSSCSPRTSLRAPCRLRNRMLEAGIDQIECQWAVGRSNGIQSMSEKKVLGWYNCRVQLIDRLENRILSHSSVHHRSGRSLRSSP